VVIVQHSDLETAGAAEPEYDLRGAWHLRAALGDALWRSEASIPLAGHRTPPELVDDLAVRFSMLGIDP
jgi:hypothetical protein